jgi:hypothetical protein
MTMKRLRFTVEITANDDGDSYHHLAWVLEDAIGKMRTDLVNNTFYLGSVKVLKRKARHATEPSR